MYRVTFSTATFKVSAVLLKEIMKIYMLEIEPIRNLKGMIASIPMQLITKDEISNFANNGGNAFGIDPDDGPLLRKVIQFILTLFFISVV